MYTRSRLKINILAISLGAILLTSGIFGFILLGARTTDIRNRANAKIMAAALALEHILPPHYHDDIAGSNSVSAAQFEALVESANQFCVANDVQYLWSVLVLDGQHIVFTAATSPDHQTTNHLHAKFFELHKDPGAFAPALQAMQPTISTFRNQWGEGRMVLIPKRDSHGRVYMLGASMAVTELDALLRTTAAQALSIAVLVALLAGLVLSRFLHSLLGPIEQLTQAAQRMTLGDLETPLVGTGSREAKTLAQAFEALRASIRQKLEVTQRSAAHIRHLNEVLRSIERVDQLILQKKETTALLQSVCETLVQTRGYVIVWAGQPDTASKRVLRVAHAGADAELGKLAPITWDDSPSGRGPSGTAIRERRTVVINDIRNDPSFALWCDAVAASGAFSLASVPLLADDFFFGAITLKADRANAFDAEEVELLNNMAHNLAHALKAIADKTELRRSKAALLEREQQYQTMLASAMDAFWVIDLTGRILDCNRTCCALLDYTRAEFLRLAVPDLLPGTPTQEFKQRVQSIVERGSERFESTHRRKDGTSIAVEVSAHFVPLLGGRIFTFIRDITERKRAEAVQQRYQLILQHARDVFLLVGLDGRIVEANAAAEEFYGRTRAELLALNIKALRQQDPPELVQQQMAQARAGGILFETCHAHKDGHLIPVEVSSRGVQMAGEEVLLSVIRDITARKAAEKLIRENEHRLRAISELNGELIWAVDEQGLYTYVSEACEPLLGYTPDEIVGRLHYYDLFPPEQRAVVRAQAEAVMVQHQKFVAFPNQVMTKDGRILEVLTSGVARFDAEGRYAGYFGSDRDVTAQKQAEAALLQSKENYRQLVEDINDAMYEVDANARFTYVSPVFQTLFGFAPDELLGQEFLPFVFEADQAAVLETFNKAMQAQSFRSEYRVQTKDGSGVRWVRSSGRTITRAGKFQGMRGSLVDITENKAAQTALWASEERFRTIVEKTADCFLLVNEVGLITYASPPIFKMTGRRPEALIGRHLLENAHAESHREALLSLGHLLTHPHESNRMAIRIKHADGSWRVLECLATNLLTHPAVNGLLVNCQDVTERNTLERQFRQAQKMEAIGTLAGGVAHDFNNMLFAIIGFTSMALKRAKKDKLLCEDLEQVLTASRRSADLVRQLLIFSRQGEKASVEVAVTPILKETFKLLRSTVPATIAFRLQMQAAHDVIKADPIQVQQVIMNLGTNAFHAMREQGGTLTFQLEELPQAPQRKDLEAPHGWLRLSMSDTGCGIAQEHIERIFEPFFSTKEVGEGTGLGLAVVHGIVTGAKGFIEVESELGRGTTFKLYFPLLATPAATPNHEMQTLHAAGSNQRVLCVDDEHALTKMLKRTMEPLGYRVTTFNDSTAALTAFQQHPQDYDLLLTDHGMPGLTGRELIKGVRRVRADIPIILLTGYDSELVTADECKELHVFLRHKPLTQEELANALHVALRTVSTKEPDATHPRD